MVNWENIKRRIKYDGKLYSKQEELEMLIKQNEERIEIQKEKEAKAVLFKKRKEETRIRMEKELEEKKAKLQQLELDVEEKMIDNELDYLNKMYIPCPNCGEDIMNTDSKCRAEKCRHAPLNFMINKVKVFE